MLPDKNRFTRIDPKRTVITPEPAKDWVLRRVLFSAILLGLSAVLVFLGGIHNALAIPLWVAAGACAIISLYAMLKP